MLVIFNHLIISFFKKILKSKGFKLEILKRANNGYKKLNILINIFLYRAIIDLYKILLS